MDIFERIKSEVQIKTLLDDLWVKYNNKWYIYDWNTYSDSYIVDSKHNIVTSFNEAKTYRAVWNPLNFYIQKTWSEMKEALEFFEKKYWIIWEKKEYKKEIEEFETINDTQRLASYLFLRWIDYSRLPEWSCNLIKSKVFGKDAPQWEVLCMQWPMLNYDETKSKFDICWYQARSLVWKWFATNGNDWFFMNFDSKLHKDYIFVVEWYSDYLSLRQFTCNVIWFKSAMTPLHPELVKILLKFNKVYLLFDNDAAWHKAKEKFKEQIDHNIYELDDSIVDDINELTKQLWQDIIDWIISESKMITSKSFQHISYSEWINMWYEELVSRRVDSVISYWFQEFDKHLWFILPWQLIVVWWIAWVGKSSLVNQIANNVSQQWFKVCRYSLEDRLQETRINEIYYQLCYLRKNKWLKYPEHYIFEANLYNELEYPWIHKDIQQAVLNLKNYNKNIIDLFHTKMIWIKELENLFKDVVLNQWVKLVIIDHLHYVKFEKEDRHDLAIERFMHELNDLLRRYNVSCILVSHYRKLNKDKNSKDQDPDNDSFKDWAAIAQVANKVIHIARDTESIEDSNDTWFTPIRYIVTKNRGKSRLWVIKARYNNGRIFMAEAELQAKRREKKL